MATNVLPEAPVLLPLVQVASLIIALLVALVALWRLLPQARSAAFPWPATIAGLAAVVVGGVVLCHRGGSGMPWAFDLLFWILALLAIASGAAMIVQRNPVYSALWFALVILSTSCLFLLQFAYFLAAATVIVYAGAIVVTFLFVIMLAQQTGLASYDRQAREPLLACIAGFAVLGAVQYALWHWAWHNRGNDTPPSLRLQLTTRLLQEAHAAVAEGRSPDEVGKTLYLDPERPESAVSNILFELTETLPAAERKQERNRLESATGKLGRARLIEDRRLMLEALGELTELSQRLELRLAGSPLSRRKGDHVAALGRSLYSDYLWAVEIAGALLLVATIGAVAIALRSREGTA